MITGGAGFIGSHLAERLLKENAGVTILDNFSVGKRENIPHSCEVVNGDVCDREALNEISNDDYSNFEVIFVDNGSTDRSVQRLFGSVPRVRVVRNQRSLGIGGGCNVGIRHARGKYIASLANDTKVVQVPEIAHF